ncbi:hypothetical protein GF373_12180 [bacterium]|nr:hypothetical protein [bacterium]
MFWKKKPVRTKKKKNYKNDPLSPVKPSPRRRQQREKRIDFRMPCYLLIEETGHMLQTTSINLSKSGILVQSLHALETGKEIICVLSQDKKLSKLDVQYNKHAMRGKIVRVEKEEMLYKMAIQITFGRVNPMASFEAVMDGKFWWTRSWQ